MLERLRNVIERTPQKPIDLVGRNALASLEELQTALLRQQEVTPTSSLQEAAISNMNFINEAISPVVREFFGRTGTRLEFSGVVYHVWEYNKSGKLGYNYDWINGEGFGTGFEILKKKNITEWIDLADRNGELTRDFARMSKKQFIEIFKNSITQALPSFEN